MHPLDIFMFVVIGIIAAIALYKHSQNIKKVAEADLAGSMAYIKTREQRIKEIAEADLAKLRQKF